MSEIKEDPELLDDETEGTGADEHYDGEAVETVPYDPTLFELPDNYEFQGDYDD